MHNRRTAPERIYTVRTGHTPVSYTPAAQRVHPIHGRITVRSVISVRRVETHTLASLRKRWGLSTAMIQALRTGSAPAGTVRALRNRGLWDTEQGRNIARAVR